MNEAFEENDTQKASKVQAVNEDQDIKQTDIDTEQNIEAAKGEGSTTANAEEKSSVEQSADAQEIERRLKELSNETQENTFSILMGFLLKKEASLFFKVVNLLKLFDIIFVFSLELSPTMLIGGLNTVGFLILYFLNKDTLKVKSMHAIASLLLLMSSIVVLLTTLKKDYEKVETSDMMSLCLILLFIWIMQTIVWTGQLVSFVHKNTSPPKKKQPEQIKHDLESSSIQNSNLMVSHNMSKDDLDLHKTKPVHQDAIHQACARVSHPDDPISSDRGVKKLKRRTKDQPKEVIHDQT